MKHEFWAGKRVLITGHTGFKGAWLTLLLQMMGAEIVGYSLKPLEKSLFNIANVATGITSIYADILDAKKLNETFAEYSPDIVFHLAAQSLVKYSYDNPVETYQTNVIGTLNILEAVRQTPTVRAVVVVTSDKCYENKEWPWGYRENEAMGGHDPYSSSKGCAEILTASYRRSYFPSHDYQRHKVALASARAGNVIGGGDWATNRLIPDLLEGFRCNAVIQIRNPNAIRPWQHVLEPLSGYVTLAENLFSDGCKYAEAWNFGPNELTSKPVSWIVNQMAKFYPGNAGWQTVSEQSHHEAHYLKLDSSKALTHLNWAPKYTINDSLQLVVEWYKALDNNSDMRSFTLGQIKNYMGLQ